MVPERVLGMLATAAVDVFRLSVWLILLALVLVPLEKLWPVRARAVLRNAVGADLFYYFLSGLVPKLLLVIPMSLLAGALHRLGPLDFYEWVAEQPMWFRIVAGLVAAEIGGYWGHRVAHAVPFLWRFHAVHHSAEEMDWLVNSRAHPIDLSFERFCSLMPLYVLGLAQPTGNRLDVVPALITILGTTWSFFIHANVNWRFGWVERLVSTPAFHHWHHTNDGADVIDKNFASLFPWVDKLFGTLYLPADFPVRYGTDTPVGNNVAEQLMRPLQGVAGSREPSRAMLSQD